MRVTDNRYAAEMAKFELAVRMIGHEARTGTIRSCTGFSEDRIRKIYATYFKNEAGNQVRRRRGKTPQQITTFLASGRNQSEATVLACLFVHNGVVRIGAAGGVAESVTLKQTELGERFCAAFETYSSFYAEPTFSFEQSWNLYNSLAGEQELYFAECGLCSAPYIQDRYALDYSCCPFCAQQGSSN